MQPQDRSDQKSSAADAKAAKSKWRKQLLDLRKHGHPGDSPISQTSHDGIAQQIQNLPEWQEASIVASYRAHGGELDLTEIDELARAAGKVVVYPRILAPGTMAFCHWYPGQSLDTLAIGLTQPTAGSTRVDPAHIDLILVPLLGCDHSGIRLGYGGGYYDRILERFGGFACGIGFDWQFIEELPAEHHDIALNAFVSPSREVRF